MSFYHPDAYKTDPPGSWWDASAAPAIDGAAALGKDMQTDIAIIGAGYTGLNAALRLRREFGLDVAVLDQATIGWGASGRNGGFCCLGGSQYELPDIAKKHGHDVARDWARMTRESTAYVGDLLNDLGIDADKQPGGERIIAHNTGMLDELADYATAMARDYDMKMRFVDKNALAEEGASGPHFHGGVQIDHGFGLHPKKYVQGMARAAIAAGISIYQHTPVSAATKQNGVWHLTCPDGMVRAKKLVIATNGYSQADLPGKLAQKVVPVLSNIIVTRPLTGAELQAQGWTSKVPTYDERPLLHYFRLLPDNRLLFGGRGGLSAAPGPVAAMFDVLEADFRQYFPAWADVEITHRWNGLVCMLRDGFPHLGPMDGDRSVYAALGWHGNGVAMGSYSGHLLAGMIAGKPDKGIAAPCLRPVPSIPFPFLRPAYMRIRYTGLQLKDRFG